MATVVRHGSKLQTSTVAYLVLVGADITCLARAGCGPQLAAWGHKVRGKRTGITSECFALAHQW